MTTTSNNPICDAMGWTVPGQTEKLMISLGRANDTIPVAVLTPARSGYSESLYLCNRDGQQYGSCFAAGPGPRSAAQIRQALGRKLHVQIDTLDRLSVEIIAPARL